MRRCKHCGHVLVFAVRMWPVYVEYYYCPDCNPGKELVES